MRQKTNLAWLFAIAILLAVLTTSASAQTRPAPVSFNTDLIALSENINVLEVGDELVIRGTILKQVPHLVAFTVRVQYEDGTNPAIEVDGEIPPCNAGGWKLLAICSDLKVGDTVVLYRHRMEDSDPRGTYQISVGMFSDRLIWQGALRHDKGAATIPIGGMPGMRTAHILRNDLFGASVVELDGQFPEREFQVAVIGGGAQPILATAQSFDGKTARFSFPAAKPGSAITFTVIFQSWFLQSATGKVVVD